MSLLSLALTLVPNVSSQYGAPPQPIAQYIQVSAYSYIIGPSGNLIVSGQVQNIGPYTFQAVYLTGTVYSTDGEDQADSFTQVYALYLLPQQKAPFDMGFPSPNNSTDGSWHYLLVNNLLQNITFTPVRLVTTTGYQYPNLTITKSSSSVYPTSGGSDSRDYGGAYQVSGEIKNTGSQTATNLTVSGTFYNSAGLVVAVGFTTFLTPENLAPSKSTSFTVYALDLNQTLVPAAEKIASYVLLPQCEEPILTNATQPTPDPALLNTPPPGQTPTPAPSISQTPTSSPSTSQTPTTSPTMTANSKMSYNSLIILVIAIIIIIIAVAGAILMLSKRKPAETVKEMRKNRKKSAA